MSSRVSMMCFGSSPAVGSSRNQDLGIVHERLREPDPLPVALGELRAVPVRHVCHSRAVHDARDTRLSLPARQALDPRDEGQVLANRHFGIERRRLREIAGAPLRLEGLIGDVVPRYDRLALRGRHVAGQHAHRRRLTSAVRPEEAEDLPTLHPEAHIIDGRRRPVTLGEVLNLDHAVAPPRNC